MPEPSLITGSVLPAPAGEEFHQDADHPALAKDEYSHNQHHSPAPLGSKPHDAHGESIEHSMPQHFAKCIGGYGWNRSRTSNDGKCRRKKNELQRGESEVFVIDLSWSLGAEAADDIKPEEK